MRPVFGVLGPLLTPAGTISATKHRILLASLLVRTGEVVSVEELTGHLWEFNPPDRPKAAIQTYVKRLRQALGAPTIRTSGRGYLADVSPESVDVFRFRELVRAADGAGVARRARLLEEALGLWRGQAFADAPSPALREAYGVQLAQERLHALESQFTTGLELGRDGDLVAALRASTAEHPLHEEFWAQLMLALYRAGRQAEALDVFAEAGRVLAAELGATPGSRLRELHQRILTGDGALAPPARSRSVVVPSQLPLDVPDFVGRTEVINEITGLLAAPAPVVISGPPGVGKTALAIRLGHTLRVDFPDGQLYANLRGFAAGPPATADQVMSQFLRGLGVPQDGIPAEPSALAALYRETLAGRRMLLVLDNAATAAQVSPLLPGGDTAATLITSRNELPEVPAAQHFTLDVLTGAAARELLVRLLGRPAFDSAANAAAELAELCGHLPLAMRIAAANIADHNTGIAQYVDVLRAENRVGALSVTGDELAAVGATFDLSHQALGPAVQRLFQVLSVVPGPDFTVHTAAALIGSTEPEAGELLTELTTANLIQQHRDRYQFHDLIRLYANTKLQSADANSALDRLYEFFLHTTSSAAEILFPGTVRLPVPPARFESKLPPITTKESAHDWMSNERVNLVDAVRTVAESPRAHYTWLLADALHVYLDSYRHSLDHAACFQIGLSEARRRAEIEAEAAMLYGIGEEALNSGNYTPDSTYLEQAREIYRATGNLEGQASATNSLATYHLHHGSIRKVEECFREALGICIEIGHKVGQAFTTANLAVACHKSGRLAEALELARAGKKLCEELGLDNQRILCQINAATYLIELGSFATARELLESLRNSSEDRQFPESNILILERLAQVELALGELKSASAHATDAAALAREHNIPWLECRSQLAIAATLLARNNFSEASIACHEAARIARSHHYREGTLLTELNLALVAHTQKQEAVALAHADRGRQQAAECGFDLLLSQFQTITASIELARGDLERSRALATEARESHQRTGHRPGEAQTVLLLARNAETSAGWATAEPLYRDALTLFEEMGTPAAAEVRELLAERDLRRT
ncbi:BTAD domain-containing putative transcriptional regulator [Crossiella sp. CA198]|uniref:AfsR/SARP family transcriptional regulator n=1 Tax=Crossiella sp. CA198 TaxID=3455607 RepID=UPI003F8D71B4